MLEVVVGGCVLKVVCECLCGSVGFGGSRSRELVFA